MKEKQLRKIICRSAAGSVLLLLTSCGLDTPSCADQRSIDLVKSAYHEYLEDTLQSLRGLGQITLKQLPSDMQVQVSTIRTTDHNWESGKYECDAVLEVTLPPESVRLLSNPIIAQLMPIRTETIQVKGDVVRSNIHYTSQITDDKHEHLVELQGHQSVAVYVITLAQAVSITSIREIAGLNNFSEGSHSAADTNSIIASAPPKQQEPEKQQRQVEQPSKAQTHGVQAEWDAELMTAIARNWSRPPEIDPSLKCKLHINLTPNGQVLSASVIASSGNALFDSSVLTAIYHASPLPLPRDPSAFDPSINVTFTPGTPAPLVPSKVGTSVPSSYYASLQGLIQNAIQYPPASVRASEQGEAKVRVHFDRSGKIIDLAVVTTTGFAKLDDEAKAVFNRIGKFPPIANGTNAEDAEFIIDLPINFTLQ